MAKGYIRCFCLFFTLKTARKALLRIYIGWVIWYDKHIGKPRKENETINKRELIETVSSKAEITKKEADAVVNATLNAIVEGLAAEGKVVIPGFGTFEVRNKTAREARNPRTGEKIKIAAKRAPAFKAGKTMKDAVEKK